MNEELEIWKIVSQRLDKANIPYVITGSMAMNYYATPRMTRDLDIVIELRKSDVSRIVELFKKDFYIDKEMILDALDHQSMFNIIYNKYVFKVDFIIRKSSAYDLLVFKRKRKVKIDNSTSWIISAEDLILSKLRWAKESMSDIQIRDIKNLLESVKTLDFEFIEKWISNLNLDEVYKKAKSYE